MRKIFFWNINLFLDFLFFTFHLFPSDQHSISQDDMRKQRKIVSEFILFFRISSREPEPGQTGYHRVIRESACRANLRNPLEYQLVLKKHEGCSWLGFQGFFPARASRLSPMLKTKRILAKRLCMSFREVPSLNLSCIGLVLRERREVEVNVKKTNYVR